MRYSVLYHRRVREVLQLLFVVLLCLLFALLAALAIQVAAP